MKRIVLFATILLLSATALCQPLESDSTLKPTLLKIEVGDYRCFTDKQYVDIVNRIGNELYCDSLNNINIQTLYIQDSLIKVQKEKIRLQRIIMDNDNLQMDNLRAIVDTFKHDLSLSQAEIKRQRKHKKIAIIAAILFGGLTIVK